MNPPSALGNAYHHWWRRVLWHRRKLAALSAGIAVFAILSALRPADPPTVRVVTASRTLSAGLTLRAQDLTEVEFPASLAPAGRLSTSSELVGHVLSSAVSAGTPLTSSSVLPAAHSSMSDGEVAVAVRLQDAGVAALLQPGQHVRLIAVDPRSAQAETLVDDAIVLGVPAPERASATTLSGRLVLFQVPASEADLVTSRAVSRYLTVIWDH